MDTMEEITSELTTNENLLVPKTTENRIKIQMSKLRHFSGIPVFLSIACYKAY